MDQSILVVDGSAVSREVIKRRLLQAMPAARVVTCFCAEEALEQLARDRFSLITTALVLPDLDGLELCRRVRASKHQLFVPIIVISLNADWRLKREGFQAGVTDYFDKDRGFKAFGQFIKSFLERNPGLHGRVLYIEDSMTAAKLMTRMLERYGLEVEHVTSAEAALGLLENARLQQHDDFDLVITDFHLQGMMTGGDLLYSLRVREHYSQQQLPVLVTTSNANRHTQVEAFHAGANDFVNKPLVEEIVMARVRSLLLVKHQYNALRVQTEDMERLATTDSLTGLRNRRYLLEEGQRYLDEAKEGWVMIVDLDYFKRINDDKGHLVGDRVLMTLGDLLNYRFKACLAVRFGGEEFVVVADGTDMPQRAETLREAVAGLRPADVDVSVSIGLAAAAEHPDADLNALLGMADKALYTAKDTGRNRVCVMQKKGAVDLETALPEYDQTSDQ